MYEMNHTALTSQEPSLPYVFQLGLSLWDWGQEANFGITNILVKGTYIVQQSLRYSWFIALL
jgi:hypothetical protein